MSGPLRCTRFARSGYKKTRCAGCLQIISTCRRTGCVSTDAFRARIAKQLERDRTRAAVALGLKLLADRAKPVMDRDLAEHFYAWLEANVAADDQHRVEEEVHKFMRHDPTYQDGSKPWPVVVERAAKYAADNYDGPPDGDEWSGGFADNH